MQHAFGRRVQWRHSPCTRTLTSGVPHANSGVVLDVDGVLYRGSKAIPGAKAAIQKLQKAKIPYVYVTNGGGMMEAQKAKEISAKLGIAVRQEQVILSHTPFKNLAKEYADKRVLVLGHEGCVEIAKNYGFKEAVSPATLHAENPLMYPKKPTSKKATSTALSPTPIAAAFVFHDPLDWGLDIQILLDVIHVDGCKQAIPFYACNADLVYNTDYPQPRITQGAFLEAFRHLYELTTGSSLEILFCGKPFTLTSRLAEKVLATEAALLGVEAPKPETIYAVGDNPRSDVRGARNAGWRSFLVKTGVWTDCRATNDPDDPADWVVESIREAVDIICEETAKK